MANVKTITATTTESAVEFNATYQFMWFRNFGENDCYISAHSGIVANADDVTVLKAGEVARLTLPQAPAQSKAYIKAADGNNTVEVHAQNFSDCPFKKQGKGGEQITVESLTATENTTYTAPTGTAYSPVTVNVPTGAEIITRSDWNALTTAQKQAKGLVAIQDASTGYERGVLVNGADYVPIGVYIPYSRETDVICEAYYDNYVSGTSWGVGNTPMVITANPTADSQEEAIYLQGKTSGVWGSIDTGAVNNPFTAYAVVKAINGDRLMCAVAARTSGNAVLFNNPSSVKANIWVTEQDTGVDALTDYVAMAMNSAGQFVIYKPSISDVYTVKLNPSSTGQYVVFGRSDLNATAQFAEPTDVKVRYAAVCDVVESVDTMSDNVKNLFAQFIGS